MGAGIGIFGRMGLILNCSNCPHIFAGADVFAKNKKAPEGALKLSAYLYKCGLIYSLA